MTETVQLKGVDQLVEKLRALGYDARQKGGRFALRKAAQFVRDQARQGARALNDPATAEDIAKNITERWNGRLFKSTGDLGFRVGVLGGAAPSMTRDAQRKASGRRAKGVPSLADLGQMNGKASGNPGGDTFYWRFLEFGTERIAARPFLRPALENNIAAATDIFMNEFDKAIERTLKKNAKGQP